MKRADRAFDPHRPPAAELIDDCVHCGFCLPTCPTYVLWGEEMDSPRGRIVLMREGLEEGSEMPSMALHFDRCLGCMACVTSCPSGVQYDRLIEATRPQVERNLRRPLSERAYRRVLYGLFTRPGRLRASVPFLVVADRTGILNRMGKARSPRVKMLASLAPRVGLSATISRLPEFTPAQGTRRGRVGFVQGCVQRVFFPAPNRATVEVLAAEGFDVYSPRSPRCCGALFFHGGEEQKAFRLADQLANVFADCDHVVANSAGCGSSMKDYGRAVEGERHGRQNIHEFSAKVRDVSEFLAEHEPVAPRRPLDLRVAYHDACHLAHAQGIRAEPRHLLAAIPGLELLEPPEWEVCCGSAGLYNLLQPDAAHDLGERKALNLLSTGAEMIAAANPGCALQITKHLEGMGRRMKVLHPIELLHASIEGRTLQP